MLRAVATDTNPSASEGDKLFPRLRFGLVWNGAFATDRSIAMGHETRISQSVRAVTQPQDGERLCLRRTLEKTLKITD